MEVSRLVARREPHLKWAKNLGRDEAKILILEDLGQWHKDRGWLNCSIHLRDRKSDLPMTYRFDL